MFANAFGQFGKTNSGCATHAAFLRCLNQRVEECFIIHAARDCIQQECSWRSVRDAMIKSETQHASLADCQAAVAYDGTCRDSSDAKNGGLRAVENWGESVNAMNAKITDGRCATFEMRWLQMACKSAFG